MEATDTAVRREITVDATPERAFSVFVDGFDTWWPRGHHIGSADLARVTIEPRPGGRFYELGVDGSECVWGEVLAYEPPTRLVLTWGINGDWQLEDYHSEIEVTFAATAGGTKVTLVHSKFEGHHAAGALRGAVGNDDGGWGGLLTAYSAAVSAAG